MPSQQLIIDGAGRWIHQQRAKEVNAALVDFLKSNAAGPMARQLNKVRVRPIVRSVRADRRAHRRRQD